MLGHACGQVEIPSTKLYLSTRKPAQSKDPEMWSFKMKSEQGTGLTHPQPQTQTLTHSLTLSLSLSSFVAAAWPKTVMPRLIIQQPSRLSAL